MNKFDEKILEEIKLSSQKYMKELNSRSDFNGRLYKDRDYDFTSEILDEFCRKWGINL